MRVARVLRAWAVPVAMAAAVGACGGDFTSTDSTTGGTSGAPAGGSSGTAGSSGASGVPTGGASGAPTGGASGVPTGGASGVPTGGASGVPTGGASGVPTGGSSGTGAAPPVLVADPPPSAVGAHNGFLALDASHVFFTYQGTTVGGVAVAPKASPGAVVCIECEVGIPRALEVNATHVYWSDTALNEVRRAVIGGGGSPTTLWTGTPGTYLALDAAGVYWYDDANDNVMGANLDGSNPRVLAGSQPNVGSMHADRGVLFWTTNSSVLALDLASANAPLPLATGRNNPASVDVDATHVYWAEGTWNQPDNAVLRVPRGGGSVEAVTTTGATDVFSIALDTTHVYAAGSSGGTIWRVPKAGGSPEFLATGLSYPFFIAIDATDVYFTSETTAQVFRLSK